MMPAAEILSRGVMARRSMIRKFCEQMGDILQWDQSNKIKIDFGNVLIASVSFIDEIFGKLAFKFAREEVQSKIQLVNIQDFDRALVNDILVSRFRQRELEISEQLGLS